MQGCRALAKVTLSGSCMEGVDVDAVQRSLFSNTETVEELHCLSFRPSAFPVSLRRLVITREVTWADGTMESMFWLMQGQPHLADIDIQLASYELVLTAQGLAGLQLPSLEQLQLDVHLYNSAMRFDLSWLSDVSRSFSVELVVYADACKDGLLALSQSLQSVLQSQDCFCLGAVHLCSDAQRVLSGLKLRSFGLVVDISNIITALPVADQIQVRTLPFETNLQAATSGHADPSNPVQVRFDMSWSAVVSAQYHLSVTLQKTGNPSCARTHATELRVTGAPLRWELSLPSPLRPWLASCENWDIVTGLPPATMVARHASSYYMLANQALLEVWKSTRR